MTSAPVDLHICVTCQRDEARVGAKFFDAMESQAQDCKTNIQLHPVECMSVCKRPCTVAVSSPHKWTYIIGDLNAASDTGELLDYIETYATSEHGTPPLKTRPPAIRRGTIARIPPITTG